MPADDKVGVLLLASSLFYALKSVRDKGQRHLFGDALANTTSVSRGPLTLRTRDWQSRPDWRPLIWRIRLLVMG